MLVGALWLTELLAMNVQCPRRTEAHHSRSHLAAAPWRRLTVHARGAMITEPTIIVKGKAQFAADRVLVLLNCTEL